MTSRTFAGVVAVSGLIVVSFVLNRPAPQSAPQLPDDGKLPLLVATKLRPIADVGNFKDEYGYFKYTTEPDPQLPKEEPFATDEAAIAAAQQWIIAHFGELPAYTSLELKSLEHSSSGHPQSVHAWDRGHTISFRQTYRGMPTDKFAIIYITGRTQFSASVCLCSFAPLSNSAKPVVSAKFAIKALRDVYEGMDIGSEFLAQFDNEATAILSYVWSPEANEVHSLKTAAVLAPTWVIDNDERLLVDAHTGKPWMND